MSLHDKRFPGESDAYREARNELLKAEIELRRQVEAVAAQRRALPVGGVLKEDYVFNEMDAAGNVSQIAFSELFEEGKDALVIYNFMFAPEAKKPCPSCTSILDSLDGNVHHLTQQINLVACARAPIERFRAWGKERGWRRLRLISSYNNSFNSDYHAEREVDQQLPILNVFQKTADGIHHFYSSELFYAPWDDEQGPRHVDMLWPIWNVLDATRQGRGDFLPRNSYDS